MSLVIEIIQYLMFKTNLKLVFLEQLVQEYFKTVRKIVQDAVPKAIILELVDYVRVSTIQSCDVFLSIGQLAS